VPRVTCDEVASRSAIGQHKTTFALVQTPQGRLTELGVRPPWVRMHTCWLGAMLAGGGHH
jgi:hypothetical protein